MAATDQFLKKFARLPFQIMHHPRTWLLVMAAKGAIQARNHDLPPKERAWHALNPVVKAADMCVTCWDMDGDASDEELSLMKRVAAVLNELIEDIGKQKVGYDLVRQYSFAVIHAAQTAANAFLAGDMEQYRACLRTALHNAKSMALSIITIPSNEGDS